MAAQLIEKDIKLGTFSNGRVYKLDSPVTWWHNRIMMTTDYVYLSKYGTLELYAFPCDCTGKILDMLELPGSAKGDVSFEDVLAEVERLNK